MSNTPEVCNELVSNAIEAETGFPVKSLNEETRLRDIGIESVLSVGIVERLEKHFGPLSKSLMLEFDTLGALVTHLSSIQSGEGSERGDSLDFDGGLARKRRRADEAGAAPFIDASATSQPIVNCEDRSLDARGTTGILPPIFAPGFSSESEVVHSAKADSRALKSAFTQETVPSDTALAATTETRPLEEPEVSRSGDVAIIGMAGQFPKAGSVAEFWSHLTQGDDCIEVIPDRLWDWRDFWDERAGIAGTSYCKWGGFIPDHRLFDPSFFRMSRLEAESVDPQERVFLETVYHALEDAQYPRRKREGLQVGLFVAVMWGSYQHYGSMTAEAGGSYATIANRASYALDLTGPSLPVDTMCSGSLTTLHLGAQSILNGECDMAVAGGVNLTTHPNKYFVLSRTGFAARSGRCRPFAADADGYVPAEASGALVLKSLRAARRDGDRILGVLRHSGVNHGGTVNNMTMPNVEAQSRLIDGTFDATGISADSIDYVEAHAPGTKLGDPIEVRALSEALKRRGASRSDIPIGSVKSNIGHAESAAGVASVIKTLEQMRHHRLAPSIHAADVNPNITFEDSPLELQVHLEPWKPRVGPGGLAEPYRAMINCFGAGGANAHALIESVHEEDSVPAAAPEAEELFLFSAASEASLRLLLGAYVHLLENFSSRHSGEHAQAVREAVIQAIADAAGVAPRHIRGSDRLADLLTETGGASSLRELIAERAGVWFPESGLEHDLAVDDVVEGAQFRAVPGCLPSSVSAERAWLQSVARTTQTARDFHRYRVAVVAGDQHELLSILNQLVAGEDCSGETVFVGNATADEAARLAGEVREGFIAQLLEGRRLERIAEFWASGLNIAFEDHAGDIPMHVDLPLYPFDHQVCWAPTQRPTPLEPQNPRGSSNRPSVDLGQSVERGKPTFSLAPSGRRELGAQARVISGVIEAIEPDSSSSVVAGLSPSWALLDKNTLEGSELSAISIDVSAETGVLVEGYIGDEAVLQGFLAPYRVPSGPLIEPRARAGDSGKTVLEGDFSNGIENDLGAALQAVIDLVGGHVEGSPAILGRVIRHAAVPRAGRIIARAEAPGEFEVVLVSAEGSPILTCTRVASVRRLPIGSTDSRTPRYFESQWNVIARPATKEDRTRPIQRVLIVAPSEMDARVIAATPRYRQASCQTIVVRPSAVSALQADGNWTVALADDVAARACLELAEDPEAIVFLSSGDPSLAADELILLHQLAQQAIARDLLHDKRVSFTVVTRGATPAADQAPAATGLGGYVRTLARECDRPIAHLDIETGQPLTAETAAWVAECPQWSDHDRPYALYSGQLYQERIQERRELPPPEEQFQEDGHYLLVGGNGTVGRQLSLALARSKRARITWVSRGELSQQAEKVAREIREAGGQFLHVRADVADARAFEEAYQHSIEKMGPVHGILHLTMTRDIRRIPDLTVEDFRELLRGKIAGTDSVIALMRQHPISFAVLFSTVDVPVGSAGWSAYTASCSYQVGAAAEARVHGLNVSAINWGFWEGIDDSVASTLEAKGIGRLSVDQGLYVLNSVLGADLTGTLVPVADEPALRRMGFELLPAVARRDKTRAIDNEEPSAGPAPRPQSTENETRQESRGGPMPLPPARTRMSGIRDTVGGLRALLAEILKADVADLDPDVDLLNYGVDSLLVVNIQATMEERLGPVPTALLLENNTVRAIAEALDRDHPQVAQALSPTASMPPLSKGRGGEEGTTQDSTSSDTGIPAERTPTVRTLRVVSPAETEEYLRCYPDLLDSGELESGHPEESVVAEGRALTHGTVSLEEGRIEYFSVGEGEPVLIFSAVALTAPVWMHLLSSRLCEQFRLVVVHPPGYGLSDAVSGCGNRDIARISRDVMRSLDISGPYHLLASCLGSVSATHFAADYPDLTRSLTLVGAFHDASDLETGDPSTMSSDEFMQLAESSVATLHQDFDAVLAAEPQDGDEEMRSRVEDSRAVLLSSQKVNFLAALRSLNEATKGSLKPVLERVAAPTLCVFGDVDQIISPRHSSEIADVVSNAGLECVTGAGHFPYLTHANHFLEVFERFMSRVHDGHAEQD